MEQPFFAKYPVIAVTSANADMPDIDAYLRSIRIPLFQSTVCLDTSSLIADARQPRTSRTKLDITLGEGGGKREAAMIESIIASKVGYFQRNIT